MIVADMPVEIKSRLTRIGSAALSSQAIGAETRSNFDLDSVLG
jgi:hypothetical protein